MAELSGECCTAEVQASCCDRSEKPSCCGESHGEGCGCDHWLGSGPSGAAHRAACTNDAAAIIRAPKPAEFP